MAQKILFLHGFFASGTCIPALALKEYFSGKATVLSPDLPLHPQETLDFIQRLCNQEQPDILVGNSNGSFLAQIVASKNNIPALLGNPLHRQKSRRRNYKTPSPLKKGITMKRNTKSGGSASLYVNLLFSL